MFDVLFEFQVVFFIYFFQGMLNAYFIGFIFSKILLIQWKMFILITLAKPIIITNSPTIIKSSKKIDLEAALDNFIPRVKL